MPRRRIREVYEPPPRKPPEPDFKRELACLMCGRVAPPAPAAAPPRCSHCGGAWIIQEVYEPRYG